MKKLMAATLAVAMLAGAAFANEFHIWQRGVFAPVQGTGDSVTTELQAGWDWDGAHKGTYQSVGFAGSTESFGTSFSLDIYAEHPNPISLHAASIWVKPVDMVTVTFGNYEEQTGRAGLGFGMYTWLRMGVAGDGDDMFFKQTGGAKVGVVATPVDGLWAKAVLTNVNTDAKTTYATATYGAGYALAGLGSVSAQYLGGDKTVNVAANIGAVENLGLNLGVFVPVEAAKNTSFAVGATYGLDIATVNAYTTVALGDKVAYHVGAGADVAIADGYTLVTDARFGNNAGVTGMVALVKNCGGAAFGAGFEALFVPATDATPSVFSWKVPVKIEFYL